MLFINNYGRPKSDLEVKIERVLIPSLSVFIALQLILPRIFADNTATGKFDFSNIPRRCTEISKIQQVNNLHLIKGVSVDLDGLAEIELKPGTVFTEESIKTIINVAHKRYGIRYDEIRIIETNSSGTVHFFLVHDPSDFLSKQPSNFKYLPWSYFGRRDENNRVIIESFGYKTIITDYLT